MTTPYRQQAQEVGTRAWLNEEMAAIFAVDDEDERAELLALWVTTYPEHPINRSDLVIGHTLARLDRLKAERSSPLPEST